MTILVDSSIWIDFYNGTETEQTRKLERYISESHDICICGFVIAEVLQGFPKQSDHDNAKSDFSKLIYLDDDRSTFELSATIFRELRRHGITIRKAIDCMIASVVIQHQTYLLQNDRDFIHIDTHYPLNLL